MDNIDKSYDPKAFRRKIPKAGRSYKRHKNEKKTFDKSIDINDLVEEIMSEHLEKSKELNMSKSIEEQIDAKAEDMAKSTNSTKDVLIETIKELGVEGLKKSLPDLSDTQKELLNEVLEDMALEKSASMDANYSPERKFDKLENMGTEEENGSDDADEKLVVAQAAQHNHQGNRDPEGIEDHVIKGRGKDLKPRVKRGMSGGDLESMKGDMAGSHLMQHSDKQKAMDHADNDGKANVFHHEPTNSYHVVTDGRGTSHIKNHANSKEFNQLSDTGGHVSIKKVKKSVDNQIDEILEKGYDMKMAKNGDQAEYKEDKNQDKKTAKKEVKIHEDKMHMKKSELIEMKNEIIKSYEDANLPYTNAIIKSIMKGKLSEQEPKEADQNKQPDATAGKTRAKKESVPAIEEAKNADTKADSVKKSITFEKDENTLLKANTLGRNFHFSMNDHYDQALAKSEETSKGETLEKSETEEKPLGINDLIEKSMDAGYDEVKTDLLFKSQNKGVNTKASYSDEEMAKSVGMTVEEMNKILG